MKLHLPLSLRSALLSAMVPAMIVSLATSAPQAQATLVLSYDEDSLALTVSSPGTIVAETINTQVTADSNYSSATTLIFNLSDPGAKASWFAANWDIDKTVQIGDGTSDSDKGLRIYNGGSTFTLTISGAVTGGGIISTGGGATKRITFTGDLSGFTGTLNLNSASNGASVITLGGGTAYTVETREEKGLAGTGTFTLNSSVDQLIFNYLASDSNSPIYVTNTITGAGTIQISNTAAMVFVKSISASALTLSGASNLTFKDTVTVTGTINASGAANLTFEGNLTANTFQGSTSTTVAQTVNFGTDDDSTTTISLTNLYGQFQNATTTETLGLTTVNVKRGTTLNVSNLLQIARDGKGVLNIASEATVIATRIDMGTNLSNAWTGAPSTGKQATINLEGGTLIVGAEGITNEKNATLSPGVINLKSGTLGGTTDWSSTLAVTVGGDTSNTLTVNTNKYNADTLTATSDESVTISLGTVTSTAGTLALTGKGTLNLASGSSLATLTLTGGSLGITSTASNGTLTISTLTDMTEGGGTFLINLGESNVADKITASTYSGSRLNLTVSGATTGTYEVFQGASGLTKDALNLTQNLARGLTITNDNIQVSDTGLVTLTVTGDHYSLYWNATNGQTWSTSQDQTSWLHDSSSDYFAYGDKVYFNGNGLETVTIEGTVTPYSISVDSDKNYTFSGTGSIIGATGLTKTGTGTLTINTTNAYTGGTTVSEGTLVVGASGALGTGAVTLASGSTLGINATGSFSSILVSQTVTADGATISVTSGGANTLDRAFTGTVSQLNVSGSGTALTISTQQTNITTTTVSDEASLIINGSGSSSYIYGDVVVNNGTFTTVGDSLGDSNPASGGFGTLTLTDSTWNLTGSNATLSNVTVVLNGSKLYTNLTADTGGIDLFKGTNTFETTAESKGMSVIDVASSTTSSGNHNTVNMRGGNAIFNIARGSFDLTSDVTSDLKINVIVAQKDGSVTLQKTGNGVLELTRTNTYAGSTAIKNGTLLLTGTGTLGAGSSVTLGGESDATLEFRVEGDNTTTQVISGTGTVTQSGTGNVTLSGANTYTGTTKVLSGTLTAGNNSAFGISSITLADGATLAVGSYTIGNSITLDSDAEATISGESDGAVSSDIALASGQTLDVDGALSLTGIISGEGALTVNNNGALVLTGANTNTGILTVNEGATVQFGNGGSNDAVWAGTLAGTGNVTVNTSGTMTLTGASTNSGKLTVENSSNVQLGTADTKGSLANSTLAGSGTLTIVNGSLTTALTRASDSTATIVIDATDKATIDLSGTDGSLISSITMGSGSALSNVSGDITIGSDATTKLDLTLSNSNVGQGQAAEAVISQGSGKLIINAPTTVSLNIDALVDTLIAHKTEGAESYLTLTTGTIECTEENLASITFSQTLADSGIRLTETDGGSLVLSGEASGVYTVDSDGTSDPNTVTNYSTLGMYTSVVIDDNDTLTVSLDGAPDADSADGDGAVINDLAAASGSALVLGNSSADTTDNDAVVIINKGETAGSISAKDNVTLQKQTADTLTVGGNLTVADTLELQEGTLVLNGESNSVDSLVLGNSQTTDAVTLNVNGNLSTTLSEAAGMSGATVTVGEDATLTIAGDTALTQTALSGDGAIVVDTGKALSISDKASLDVSEAKVDGTLELSGADSTVAELSGKGAVTVTNSNLTISDESSVGSITLDNSSLAVNGDLATSLLEGTAAGSVTVGDGATLTLTGDTTLTATSISGDGTLEVGSDKKLTVSNTASLSVSEVTVAGEMELSGQTTSLATLSGNGDVTLSNSTLTISDESSVGSITLDDSTLAVNGDLSTTLQEGTTAGSVTVGDGATLTLTDDTTLTATSISGDGALKVGSDKKLTVSNTASLSVSEVTVAGELELSGQTTSLATLSGDGDVTVTDSSLTIGDESSVGSITLASTDAANKASLTVNGDLTTSLKEGTNGGTVSVGEDAQLALTGSTELTATSLTGDGSISVADGATLTLSDSAQLNNISVDLAEGSTLQLSSENNSVTALTGSGDLQLDDSASLTLGTDTESSVSSLNGTGTLAMSGGTLTVSGADSSSEFTGTLDGSGELAVEGGSMTLAADGGDKFLLRVKNAEVTLNAAEDSGMTSGVRTAVRAVRLVADSSADASVPTYKGAIIDADGILYLGKASGSSATTAPRAASTSSSTLLSLGSEGLTVNNGGTISLNTNVNSVAELVAQDALVVSEGAIALNDGATVQLSNDGSIGSADDKTIKVTLMTSDTSATVGSVTLDDKILNSIYTTSLLAEGSNVVLVGDLIEDNPFTPGTDDSDDTTLDSSLPVNATAGANLVWGARFDLGSDSVLKDVYSAVLDQQAAGDTAGMSKTLAAVAGSTINATGTAQRDALRDQIGTIRNRASLIGANGSELGHHFWIEGSGSYANLHTQGDKGGYKMTTWGGTVGADTDVTSALSLGAALTANYGDLRSHAAESATGDLDSIYVNLFGRYQANGWGHTLVLTGTNTQAKLDRTVDYGAGAYRTHGQTHGYGLGAAYELTYDVALNDKGTSLLQPLFDASIVSTKLQGYSETGAGNAGLNVGAQEWTTATLALGARWSGSFGAQTVGKTLFGDLRVALSQDFGDAQGKTAVALSGNPDFSQNVYGAKVGRTAVQIGAGISTELSARSVIYANAGAEIRNGANNVNGAVGVRVSF